MMFATAGFCLAAALALGLPQQESGPSAGPAVQAGSSATQAPAQTAPPPATPRTQEAEQKEPPGERQRPSGRTPRTRRHQSTSSAQGSFDEARTSRDGGPTRQELTLTANLLGGYDDNVVGGLGTGSGSAPTAMASGGTAYLDGTLNYFHGNSRHSIGLDSTGSLTAYPGYLDDPAPGVTANVSALTTAGRDTRFGVSERIGYEPLFNVLSQGSSSTPLPPEIGDAVPVTGLFERRSLSSSTSGSVDQRWGRRDWTSLSYSYRVQQFTEDDYGDSRSHEVTAEYRRGLSRGIRSLVEYRYRNLEYIDSVEAWRPTREHRIEGGPEIEKTLSRRRRLTFSLAAGAARLESVNSATGEPYQDWAPTGSASLLFAFSPDWNLEGGYRRDINTFQGVTDQVYTTDTAYLRTGGFVSDRVDLSLGATYGNWQTSVAFGAVDTMDVYGASMQFRVSLTNTISATASYYYYYHRYSNPASLPEGFPADYDRHAVRVGLTLWAPFIGTSPAARPTSR